MSFAEIEPRIARITRICRSGLPLALLAVSWQFTASAHAPTAQRPCDRSGSSRSASSSIDDLDCITSSATVEAPFQVVSNKSSGSTSDFDISANPSADKAVLPSRTNKKPLQLAEMSFDAVIVHDLGTVPILLFPSPCYYSLNQHTRERGPPPSRRSLGVGGPSLG